MKDDSGNIVTDINKLPIGWPYRSGSLVLQNGEKIAVKYWTIEILAVAPNPLPKIWNIPLNNAIQGFLLNSFYWSMEAYSAATLPFTPATADGSAFVIPQSALTSGFINLQDNKAVAIWNPKPLRDLQTINDVATQAGKQYADSLGGQVINWQNSNIQICDTSGLTAGRKYSIPLGLAFTFFANYQQDGVGASNYNINQVNG